MKIQFKKSIDIPQARSTLPISVGQPYHEGAKLRATLDGIQKKLGHCDIVVGDTLQRYNLLSEYSYQEAAEIARKRGDEWLLRNEQVLKDFTILHAIVRWDTCMEDPLFNTWLTIVKKHYQHNNAYKAAVEADIDEFMQRAAEKKHALQREQSRNYFLEETAVILSYFVTQKYHYFIYPRAIPSSVLLACEHFVAKQHPDLIKFIDFRFR